MDAFDDGVPEPRRRGALRPALVAFACVAVVGGSVGVTALFADRDATPESHALVRSPAKVVPRGPTALASVPAVADEPPGAVGPSSPAGLASPAPDPTVSLARSFVRTTADGTVVRVYRAAMKPPTAPGAPWAPAPPQCSPSGIVQADFSNDAIAGATQAYVYASLPNGVGGNAAIVGVAEGHGEWIVIAQVPANAASARAVFPSGVSDTMTPVDGVAVFAGAAGATDQYARVRVDAVDAGGNVVGSAMLNGSELQPPYLEGISLGDCNAPTQLPPPGAQQPADPVGARQAVIALVARGWAPGATDAEKFSNFDDSHGFEETQRELRAGSDAAEANSAILATVDNLVFLSPTEAAFQFTFHITGFGTFGGFFGAANLSDGTWKMTRSTYCDALATTPARCPA